jgi:hypothetical protein
VPALVFETIGEHRPSVGTTAGSDMAASFGTAAREAEKCHPIPACPGHLRRDGAERAIVPALVVWSENWIWPAKANVWLIFVRSFVVMFWARI